MYCRISCAAVLCAALALSSAAADAPAAGAAAPAASRATEALADAWSARELAATALDVPAGGRLFVSGVELAPGAPPEALELERFEVFTPDAVVLVHGAEGEQRHPVTRGQAWFRGRVAGEPASLAVLSVRPSGEVRGVVQREGGMWILGGEPATAAERTARLAARAVDAATSGPAADGFTCAADELEPPPVQRLTEPSSTAVATLPGASYTARVAIETDWELYQRFGNADALAAYVGDLFSFVSAIYDQEIATDLQISHLSVWTTSSDPWTQTNASCGLYQFGSWWNTNQSGVDRTLAHFLSGKSSNAGVAWVGVLCEGAFAANIGTGCPGMASLGNYGGAYGYSGGLDTNFDLDNPQVVWDLVVTAHEIGHNFNSPHTHCYNGLGGSSQPVDQCYNGQAGNGCYAGSTSLPCGTAGAGCGTLMSYCHFQGGGLSNIGLSFGTGHPFGVLPQRVPDRMRSHVEARAGAAPACLARVTGCNPLTLGHSGSGGDPTAVPSASVGCAAGSYTAGERVELLAAPAAGWQVESWSGTDDDGSGFVANTLTMPAAAHAAGAAYVAGCDDLTLSSGTDNGVQLYDACGTLTAGTSYRVGGSGDVTLRSYQRVVLTDGFRVDAGGSLRVVVP
jgi:hypothetical protein